MSEQNEEVESEGAVHHLAAPSGEPAEGTVGPVEDDDLDEEVECDDS